jgi:hypothetical protein
MKTKIIITIAGMLLMLFSCNKDSDIVDQQSMDDASFEATADAVFDDVFAIADNATLEAEDPSKGEAAEEACPTRTVTRPDGQLWPMTVTLDYGTGCTGFNNHTRSGKIIIVVTGPRMQQGSKRTITFDNYYMNDMKVEGTKVLENKGPNTAGHMVVSITLTEGKITFTDGRYISRQVSHEREWIAGLDTKNIWDDECLITGVASGTNRRGVDYVHTILEPLHWKRVCAFIVEGILKIERSGDSLPMTIDYGTGECDAKAVVTRGDQSKEILLKHRGN